MLKNLLSPLASLKLTVVLLALSMLLVYAGTWAQIDQSILQVQDNYFHAWFSWVPFQIFWKRDHQIPGGFPMVGGFTLGALMLVNLLAAHFSRFKLSWKRSGIILIHLALILLLVGEGVRAKMAVETQMPIEEGSYSNYSQNIHKAELAIVDTSPVDHNLHVVIPDGKLAEQSTITDSRLPFDVKVERYYANSQLVGKNGPLAGQAKAMATAGEGIKYAVLDQPKATGVKASDVDVPSAFVTLSKSGQPLGTYLASAWMDKPDQVTVDGRVYELQLRFERHYKPYTIHLHDFRHDKYLGTDVPMNYSSNVRLVDASRNEDREVKIWMNHPLRYEGETFFQSSFRPADPKHGTVETTILQVVRNPGWLMPYIACVMGGIGLLVHFGIVLLGFLRKQSAMRSAAAATPIKQPKGKGRKEDQYVLMPQRRWTKASFLVPLGITLFCAIYVAGHLSPRPAPGAFDLQQFGQIPVTFEGRTQPLESLARDSLKMLSGRESLKKDGERIPAVQWLIDVMTQPDLAHSYRAYRIDLPEILDLLQLNDLVTQFNKEQGFKVFPEKRRFSVEEILSDKKIVESLDSQLQLAGQADKAGNASLYQRKLLELGQRIRRQQEFSALGSLHIVPPMSSGEEWQTLRESSRPIGDDFINVLKAYVQKNPAEFNRLVAQYNRQIERALPAVSNKMAFEQWYRQFDPWMQCIVLYIIAFVLAVTSWLGWSRPLARSAFWIINLTLLIHTFGLVGRIYMSDRPPVTNLASSALFIAWGAVMLGAGLEYFFRNGIGSAAAAVVGFPSLLIYGYLAMDGDTMKVLQAVLDTNFWLATHVVVITLGYAATFLAGLLGVIYVVLGVFTPVLGRGSTSLTPDPSPLTPADPGKVLSRMIYGITCFAILFSFVGTVLGGIWADQSWGRFWGWDPKENGAVLIVLANAITLHARWSGLARDRGVAILAIFGNIITAWSWFGTNMLGVGLHAYGFMDAAFKWLLIFVGSQLLLIALANVPLTWWRSRQA